MWLWYATFLLYLKSKCSSWPKVWYTVSIAKMHQLYKHTSLLVYWHVDRQRLYEDRAWLTTLLRCINYIYSTKWIVRRAYKHILGWACATEAANLHTSFPVSAQLGACELKSPKFLCIIMWWPQNTLLHGTCILQGSRGILPLWCSTTARGSLPKKCQMA